MVWCGSYFLYAEISHFLPVATAFLVAGLTLTLWMPGQTLFASTSSYSGLVQRLPAACIMQVASLWLIPVNSHDTCQPCCLSLSGVSNGGQKANDIYYRIHKFAFRVIISTLAQGTTLITIVWTESSWAFPESYTATENQISNSGQQEDKTSSP